MAAGVVYRALQYRQMSADPHGPVPPVNPVWLCCLGTLTDKSIEDRPSVYPRPGKIRDRWWGRVDCRGKLSSGLVRPMPVVMDDVLAQGGEEMSFAVNEALVQTLPARGANPALRERVRPRRPRWRAHDPHALRREDRVERSNELRIPIPDQERDLGGPVAQIHHQVAGLLGHPLPPPRPR